MRASGSNIFRYCTQGRSDDGTSLNLPKSFMTSEWLLNLFHFQFGNSKETNYGKKTSFRSVVMGHIGAKGNDDIGHRRYRPHHIGHKACHVFVRLVNQGGQCAAASKDLVWRMGYQKNLKWTICGNSRTVYLCLTFNYQ